MNVSIAKKASKFALAASAAALFSAVVVPAAFAVENADPGVKCQGINACKGQSKCKTASNACSGQNSCKGKGWVWEETDGTCKGKGGTVIK